jgi:hypothetical protein
MQEIERSLAGLALGAPQVHRNLALFPLLGADEAGPGCVLLDEALARGLARVTEVSESGSVPELAFENTSAERILLVDGDELVGAKQNRIVNLSLLVGAGKRIVIPVACVEQGRWAWRSREFRAGGRSLFAKARAMKMAQVSDSLRSSGSRRADQGGLWQCVAEKISARGVDSATLSLSDVYEASEHTLAAYVRAFRAEPGQRGAVLALDGRVVGLELFDSAAAFARYLPKLVRSYALDALETANGKELAPPESEVRAFLDRIRRATAERFPALGEGEDVRLSGEGIAGGALAAEGRVVHLAGYALA